MAQSMTDQYIKFGSVKKGGDYSQLFGRAVGKMDKLSTSKRKDLVVRALEFVEILEELKITDSLYGIWLTHNSVNQECSETGTEAKKATEAMLEDLCNLILRKLGKSTGNHLEPLLRSHLTPLESEQNNAGPASQPYIQPELIDPRPDEIRLQELPPIPSPGMVQGPAPQIANEAKKIEAKPAKDVQTDKPKTILGGMMKLS